MPKSKGIKILEILMIKADLALFLNATRSSSIPMINIKKASPILLKTSKLLNEFVGKMKLNRCGKRFPKTERPKNIPATISPITAGCLNFEKRRPNTLEVTRISKICSNSKQMGC